MTKKSKERTETRKSNRVQREAKFDADIAQFDADIEEAGKIDNPADKILKLDKIRQNIWTAEGAVSDAVTGEAEDIASEARRAGDKAFIIFMPTLIGPGIADDRRRKSVQKKLETEAEGHLQKMAGQQEQLRGLRMRVGELINTTAENGVVKISQSQSCEQVLKVYGVTAIFARAAAKQVAVYAARLDEAAPPQEEAAGRKRGTRLIGLNR